MIATWTLGLLRRRRGRLAATAAGIAAAVALLACLGSFLAAAQGSMTARAIRSVTVDWQVEVQPDTQQSTVLDTVRSAPNIQAALPVGYAHSAGFVAQTGGSTQTTGPAMVLGIPPNYRKQFPGAIRTLVGADNGVLIAQQTAANLHAAPGDTDWRSRPQRCSHRRGVTCVTPPSPAETEDTKRGHCRGSDNRAQRLDAHASTRGGFQVMGEHGSSVAPRR